MCQCMTHMWAYEVYANQLCEVEYIALIFWQSSFLISFITFLLVEYLIESDPYDSEKNNMLRVMMSEC